MSAYRIAAFLAATAVAGARGKDAPQYHRALIAGLASAELQGVEQSIPVGAGDFAWHFVQVRWNGTEMHGSDGNQSMIQRFTLSYEHNFARGRPPCEVQLTVTETWPIDDRSKLSTAVTAGMPSCKRGLTGP